MNAIETLRLIAAECTSQMQTIKQLSLNAWISLAGELGVELNDREHAAKKLALRKLKAEGKI